MNDAPAAIQATFHTFKAVLGRKQLQLIFEVPLTHTQAVLRFLGNPESDSAQWFAIARIQPEYEQREGDSTGE